LAYVRVTSADTGRSRVLRPRRKPGIRVAQVTAGTRCYGSFRIGTGSDVRAAGRTDPRVPAEARIFALIPPINENWPSRFAAEPVCTSNCGLAYADDGLIVGIVVKVPVMLFEVVGETQHLKAVAITDGPELDIG